MYHNKETPTSESKPFVSVQRLPVFDELYTQYPPVRVRLTNQQVTLNVDPINNIQYIDLNLPIKYGGLIHPTRGMVKVEYCSLLTTTGDPLTNIQVTLPELSSVNDFINSDYSTTVWQGTTVKTDVTPLPAYDAYPAYSKPINTNEVGFPVRDSYLLNNRNLKLRLLIG